uniref:NADH-ubiquinone oxidoreductase chain 4 n=1 Tax=Buergeria buergeri TaxID=191197 RepID=Q6L7H8_BUEBU|nr:NADH dehydrogenase subunit 4 [Buergeria buergeri]
MLMVLLAWSSIFFTTLLTPTKRLWTITTAQAFSVMALSLVWFYNNQFMMFSNSLFFIDHTSSALSILTCWLFPLTLIASQSKISLEPHYRQRIYIANSTFLQLMTLLAFTTADLMMFFIFFEASLIPTIIIITRWGAQERRMEAGMYLAFYTMLGAVPLMICLIKFYSAYGSLLPTLLSNEALKEIYISHPGLLWTACNMAFLVKLPLFFLHLWLPKAHVEAPIAGSMVLAGTLLKLGGYGILRMSPLIGENMVYYAYPMMFIAILGVLATALLCLRQTDLKSLIAMSSVSHMNLVVTAVLIQSPWAYSGALVLMISHGFTSSALFCLANTVYERTNSRAMVLLRGATVAFPLAAAWWLIVIIQNIAIPPTISFVGEFLIMASLFSWSSTAFLVVVLNLMFTTAYSLYVLWATQRGPLPHHIKSLHPFQVREHTLLLLHVMPALIIILKPILISL